MKNREAQALLFEAGHLLVTSGPPIPSAPRSAKAVYPSSTGTWRSRCCPTLSPQTPTGWRNIPPVYALVSTQNGGDRRKITTIVGRYPIDPKVLGFPMARGEARIETFCFNQTGQRRLRNRKIKFNAYGYVHDSFKIPKIINCNFLSQT